MSGLVLAVAYLIGSLQAAVIVAKLAGLPDPRTAHSGNPGTTNTWRTAGPGWAVVVLCLDVGRAALVGWMAHTSVVEDLVPWVGVILLLGTILPIFHGFRGGKGVATLLGFALATSPWITTSAALAAWVLVWLATRQPFLGSLLMVTVLCAGLALGCGTAGWLGATMTLGLIFLRHRPNIVRWWAATDVPPPP